MTGSPLRSALEHPAVQAPLAAALLVPLAATVGQYAASGFWGEWTAVELLFWPGAPWKLAVRLPVWLSMGAMLAAYVAGIAWLVRKRTLTMAVLAGMGVLVAAQLAAAGVNALTGWRELQKVSSMDLAGKANRAVFALWHNPTWEELVFRGVPLLVLLLVLRKSPRATRPATWGYYAIPSAVFAAYHVPGHGPSRIVDTLVLGLVFAWMARRFGFFAPLVLHDVFDAMMTLSLGKLPNIPKSEVAWLVANATTLNSAWSVALLLWLAAMPLAYLGMRVRARRSEGVPGQGAVAENGAANV